MAGDEAIPSELDEGHVESERFARTRRRPWLGIVCAVLLVLAGLTWWIHAEDPFNPYRDGTTHSATMTYTYPPCIQGWTATLDGGRYRYQGAPPAALGSAPLHGTIHILRQRVDDVGYTKQVAATFTTASGVAIDLVGGREPWWSDLSCSIR